MKRKSRTLTIFLIKDACSEPNELFKPRSSITEFMLSKGGQNLGKLYVQPTSDRRPDWTELFRGAVHLDSSIVRNASTAAVWLVDIGQKRLALTFGYGRNLINPSAYEEDFGLRITLNSVDPNKIKAIDRMTLDAVAQQARIQASRDAAMSEFGLDVEQDLLRAVTGTPLDSKLGQRLTGRDALQTTLPINLEQVPELLARCLEEYAKDDYKSRFPWVEQIHEIDDPMMKASLDQKLVRKLRTGELDGLWLAVPEMIDWDGVGGFKYRTGRNAATHSDIHVLRFLSEIDDPADIDDCTLKKTYHVSVIGNDNDAVVKRWPVYRCLYCEVADGENTFLLNNAKWFRIATDFVQRITDAVENIPENTVQLPDYHDKSEAAYSKRVAEAEGSRFALMDFKLIGSSSLPSKVEFCDLYGSDRKIVHLKRYSSSSTLSHLFAQGVVSAKLFLNETGFRHELNELLPATHRLTDPKSKPNASEFEVVFGIISQSKKRLILPFFSRVNLENAHSNLAGMGLQVSRSKIAANQI